MERRSRNTLIIIIMYGMRRVRTAGRRGKNINVGHYTQTFGHYTQTFEHYTQTFGHYTQTFGHYTQTFGHYTQTFGHYTQTFGHYTQAFGHYTQTFQQHFSYLFAYGHHRLLPFHTTFAYLDFVWGSQGQSKAKPLGFTFSHFFQLIRMKFDMVLQQFKFNFLILL